MIVARRLHPKESNSKYQIWIEVISVLFILFIIFFNFNFSMPKINWFSWNFEDNVNNYLEGVNNGFDIAQETFYNIKIEPFVNSINPIKMIGEDVLTRTNYMSSVYFMGINKLKNSSSSYASVFYSNLINNLGVIQRQISGVKKSFCQP